MIITHSKSKLLDDALELIETLSSEARVSILGDTAKQNEYTITEQQALIFKNMGFTGAVPQAVDSWAKAKGWTAKQAAEDILRAATLSKNQILQIRDARLIAKESVKLAKTAIDVNVHVTTFKNRLIEITRT